MLVGNSGHIALLTFEIDSQRKTLSLPWTVTIFDQANGALFGLAKDGMGKINVAPRDPRSCIRDTPRDVNPGDTIVYLRMIANRNSNRH